MTGNVFQDVLAEMEPEKINDIYENPFQAVANSKEFKNQNEEGFLKSTARAAFQIPQGIAEATTYGQVTGLHTLLSSEVYDPEEIERLKEISNREGIPFDEESYLEAANQAIGTIPTVSNIASKIEEKTGLPLEAKTRAQKAIRFLSMATKAVAPKGNIAKATNTVSPNSPGLTLRGMNTNLPAPVLGGAISATKELLQEMGVPEQFAEIASFGVIKPTTQGSPTFISPQKKPSGLTTRRYERITEPTEISGGKLKNIQRKTSGEVKGLAKDIIKESPIGETYQKMKDDITYKRQLEEGFNEVKSLAKDVPGNVDYSLLKEKIKAKIGQEKGIKVTDSTKEKSKILKSFIEDLGEGKATIADLEERYRTNNRKAAQSYDPGMSWDANQAKREALLEYNQAIAEIFEEVAPNTQFLRDFRQRNAEWTSLMDAEMVDNFLEQMTKGKIRYEKGKEFFRKNGMDKKFKRALGNEGYHKFETLLKDMLSTEEAMSLLSKKADPGLMPFLKKAMYFAVDPTLGEAKIGFDIFKGGYNKIFEMILDKPELAVNWDRGINALKKGDIKVANQEFGKVAQAENKLNKKQESLKKYKEYVKERADKTKASANGEKTQEAQTVQLKKKKEKIPEIKKESKPVEVKKSNEENLAQIGQIGSAISENFYKGIYESLKQGKTTFSGVKDPLLIAAKPAYEAGQIKSVEDLKAFAKYWDEALKNKFNSKKTQKR